MSTETEKNIRFCEEHVAQFDPWFGLHRIFIAGTQQKSVLALHTVFSMLERALSLSEESLITTQLLWWRSELESEQAGVSAHPAIKTLRESGGHVCFSPEITNPLIAQSLMRHQAEPLSNVDSLRKLCHVIGSSRLKAEWALGTDESPSPELTNCAGLGLAVLLEFAIRVPESPWWFLPLDLQARFQVNEIKARNIENSALGALRALAECGAKWFADQRSELRALTHHSESEGMIQKHLLTYTRAREIRFEKSVSNLAKGGNGEPGSWKLTDVFRVWSSGRGVK